MIQKQQQPQPTTAVITTRVLQVLEALDRHSFDRVDSVNNIDSLYAKVFPPVGGMKANPDSMNADQIALLAKQDEPIVRLLCQWAVSDQRYGEHRAMATALLLEKRQTDLITLVESDTSNADDNEVEENSGISGLLPIYQV